MEESSQIVVVPWDFTQVAENALAHAVKIAKTLNNEIRLLHIVDSGIKNNEEMKVRYQLQQIAEISTNKYGNLVSSDVVKGSIFTDIA